MKLYQTLITFFEDSHLKQIAKGGIWSFIAKIITVIIGLGLNLIIARYYGSNLLGVLAIVNSVLMFATLFSNAGMNSALIKLIPQFSTRGHNSVSKFIYKKILLLTGLFSTVMSIILYVGSEYLSTEIFNNPQLKPLFELVSFAIFIKSFEKVTSEMFVIFQKVNLIAFSQMLPNLSNFIILVLAMGFISDEYLPVYVYIFSPFITFSILIFFLWKLIRNHTERINISVLNIFSVSFPMLFTASMFLLMSQTDIIMLGMMTSTSDVGVYSIDVRLASLCLFVLSSLLVISIPKFSNLYHSNNIEELKNVAQKSTQMIFWGTMPLLLVLIVFGKFFLSLFGEEFIFSYTTLIYLLIGQAINAMTGPVGGFLNMTGNHLNMMYITGLSASVNIILNVLLIPNFGIEGAAIATLFSIIVLKSLAVYVIYKHYNFMMLYNPFTILCRR